MVVVIELKSLWFHRTIELEWQLKACFGFQWTKRQLAGEERLMIGSNLIGVLAVNLRQNVMNRPTFCVTFGSYFGVFLVVTTVEQWWLTTRIWSTVFGCRDGGGDQWEMTKIDHKGRCTWQLWWQFGFGFFFLPGFF